MSCCVERMPWTCQTACPCPRARPQTCLTSNRQPEADGSRRDAAEPRPRVPATMQPCVPATARPLRTRDDVSEHFDMSSGPIAMAHHPGTRLLTCSWPYDVPRAWGTSRRPQDAPDTPNGVSMPFGTSPDVPNVGLAIPQAGRTRRDAAQRRRCAPRPRMLIASATTCLITQTRRLDHHPWSATREHVLGRAPGPMMRPAPGTHRTCRTACSRLRAHSRTCRASRRRPSGRRKSPGRRVSRPCDRVGSLHARRRVWSSRHVVWTHLPRSTTPRAYPGLRIRLWAPG